MNRYICGDLSEYWIKCFLLKHSFLFDNGDGHHHSSDGTLVIWAINPSNAGRLIRDNKCYDIWDVMPDVLAIESYYYADEAEEKEDWLLNLPETLKDIYRKRRKSGIDEFSLPHSFNFWSDISKLSDLEIFQLVEQKIEFWDNVVQVEHMFISSWEIEGS